MGFSLYDRAPIVAIVINSEARVDYINLHGLQQFELEREQAIGKLGGQAINCVNAYIDGGCGQTSECESCPLRNAVMQTMETGNEVFKKEGTLTLNLDETPADYHMLISTNRVIIDGTPKVLLFVDDVTKLKKMVSRSQEISFQYQKLFSEMSLGFAVHEIICDDAGNPVDYRFLEVNPTFEKLTGLKKDTILGKTVLEVLPSTEPLWIKRYGETALSGKTFEFQSYSQSLDRHYEVKSYSLGGGKFAVLFTDITKYKSLNDKLERISMIDELTSLENRRAFNLDLERELARATREQQPLSAIMLDVDHFKGYNDLYGHITGDQCLKTVASIIRKTVQRKTDRVCRYGGEEFIVLLPNTDSDSARQLAMNILSAVEAEQIEHQASSVSNYLTLSAGVACITPKIGHSHDILVEMADTALYSAKKAGRNNCKVYNQLPANKCT